MAELRINIPVLYSTVKDMYIMSNNNPEEIYLQTLRINNEESFLGKDIKRQQKEIDVLIHKETQIFNILNKKDKSAIGEMLLYKNKSNSEFLKFLGELEMYEKNNSRKCDDCHCISF